MAVTISGSHGDYDNVKDTFPQSTSLTGTIDAVANGEQIVGTGTLFTTELQIGEYIYIASQSAFRKIRSITDDTNLYLYPAQAFPTPTFSGATPRRVPKNTYHSISWAIDATGTAKIDNITFPASQSGTMSEVGGKRPEPILIDSTENSNNVYIEFQI